MYVIFVDYKRAFDSIHHNMLWNKLYKLGLSGKIIRLLKNIYDNASFKVRAKDSHTKNIQVTEVVLQGEILSPILFSLYISDFDDFFQKEGSKSVSMDHKHGINSFMFADDKAILADTAGNTKNKLNILEKYCKVNSLTVNVTKTKIHT